MEGPPLPSPVVAQAWSRLCASHGQVSAKELAAATGRGSRWLQTLFREQIGLPPRTASRILRFQRALTLPTGACRSLADRATVCGYHDQAHMNRDFRDLAGITPAQLCLLADRAVVRGTAPIESRLASVFDHCRHFEGACQRAGVTGSRAARTPQAGSSRYRNATA
ncbi:helix-turn-helix domain-containing protein [Streptomyces sp. NPDC007164]|uniref:helix-turn-helix domain-containing protein n=1 Tax=Streptomyces sp. NPDC007164 TaxID=3156918 RepID=UPI0033DA19A8